MNFLSPLVRHARKTRDSSGDTNESYESILVIRSKALPAVTFAIKRVSFARRIDLGRRAREISRKAEFLEAGGQLGERIEAGILTQEIDAMYLAWGLVSIQGLSIDGETASAESLLEKGPEALTGEIVDAIKTQCGLRQAERKN